MKYSLLYSRLISPQYQAKYFNKINRDLRLKKKQKKTEWYLIQEIFSAFQ